MNPSQNQQPFDISRLQDVAMNVVYNVCGIICMPVEMALRIHYGSRYFPPMMMMFSIFMMLALPLLESLMQGLGSMIPFMPHAAPAGAVRHRHAHQVVLYRALRARVSHVAAHDPYGPGGEQPL